MSEYVKKIIRKAVKSMNGVKIKEIGIDDRDRDYIHMILETPPKYSCSEVISKVKVKTTQRLGKEYKWLKKYIGRRMWYGREDFLSPQWV